METTAKDEEGFEALRDYVNDRYFGRIEVLNENREE